MPTVVNRSQQVYTGGLAPAAAYSRIVSLSLVVLQAWGQTYVVTQPLGNNIWLLGIQVWCIQKAPDASEVTYFNVYSGTGPAKSVGVVLAWENVLPMISEGGFADVWTMCDGRDYMRWDFAKLFTGAGRRLGIVGSRYSEVGDVLRVSFHISEG